MFTVSKEVEFDAGHRVPNHSSKCRNPHGHRYRVRATISGELVTTPGASDEGMLADFGDLKTLLTESVHDVFDHGFIVYEYDEPMYAALEHMRQFGEDPRIILFPYIPTAENIARWIWDVLKPLVYVMKFDLQLIEVWETPTSLATYTRRNSD